MITLLAMHKTGRNIKKNKGFQSIFLTAAYLKFAILMVP